MISGHVGDWLAPAGVASLVFEAAARLAGCGHPQKIR
jgi:hypothetical protein